MSMVVQGPTVEQSGLSIGAQVKAFTIRTFESALIEEVRRGFDNEPIISTDGYLQRDYHDVRNFGRIEARSRAQLGDVVQWLLDELRRLSPVLTGRYRDSHVVWADGHEVSDLSTIQDATRVMVVNTQPYAGKIEGKDAYTRYDLRGGKRSRRAKRIAKGWKPSALRGESKQAPRGVYRVAIANLQNRFGKTVVALYQPQQLPLGVTVKSRRRRGTVNRAQIYPAIILSLFR